MALFIGTSGWTYPHWKKTFFPEKLSATERLHFYAQHFSSVEINTTFYGTPARSTVRAWKEAVPKTFRFAIKASRFTTHNKKLLEPRKSTVKFFRAIEPLGEITLAILFQLPPKWKFNPERLGAFLKKMPRDYRYAFEFRNPTWLCPEAFDLLREYRAALCIYDLRGFLSPLELTADFTYLRLHGPQAEAYRGSYPAPALEKWKREILAWRKKRKDVYVYFDNDEKAYAAGNAQKLIDLVGPKHAARHAGAV
jgi:uncharacterized protein YecE (DUF72 family)